MLLGRQHQALGLISRALQADPTDVQALASRAHVLAEQGEKPAALQALAQLVSVAPEHSAGWFNYGFLSEDMGLLEQAESAFQRAIALDPQFDRAWYGLALSLIRQRRLEEAITALKKNTELQPMSPYGWYQLARVHVERQESEEAAKIIRHLRRFEPKVADQLERETGLRAARLDVV
ncbi:MAG: tetratricopeptide repeat protein [Hydrogenophaga sp.]|nr:tetratricopeptide repeat protein [Hydrogenophaga sp.]